MDEYDIRSFIYVSINHLNYKLNPKECNRFYCSNKTFYNVYIENNKFEINYFTPKNTQELQQAVNEWYRNKEAAILKYGNIGYWNTINIVDMNRLFFL